MPEQPSTARRGFMLGLTAGIPLLGAGIVSAWSPPALSALPVREVAMRHQRTGETVRTAYFADGRYLEEGLKEINRLMRDWRTDEVIEIDPKVLDIVFMLQRQLETSGPVEVLSGYRSPETNAMLRRSSRAVAKNSLHMYGMAVDLRFHGRGVADVNRAATALHAGGVGFYPASNFVHVDSGPVRHWMQYGRVTAGTDGGVPRGAKRGVGRNSLQGSRRAKARAARQASIVKGKAKPKR